MPESGHIGFSLSDGVATLRLMRPEKRNAISQTMLEEIRANLTLAADDPTTRVLLIEGVPGIFCAGGDLTWVKHHDVVVARRYNELSLDMHQAIRDFPSPTVAVIDGLCIGGGCNIALACDIRLASQDASFSIPAVRHGIVYDQPSIARLVELVGPGKASHFLFTARRIGSEQAVSIGLVDVLCRDLAEGVAMFLEDLKAADSQSVRGIRARIRTVRAQGGNER